MNTSPDISIIIPARNEERNLPECINAVRAAAADAQLSFETIVVVNRCTDRTEQVARELGCTVILSEEKNLAKIRNAGIAAARAPIIVTIDADSRMSANLLDTAKRLLDSGRYVGGGVLILPDRWSVGILMTGLFLIPVALWYGISAGAFFARREDVQAIGGFNEALSSVEDIDFARRLKRHGKQSGRRFANLFRAHIVTSARKFDHFGDWYFVCRPWVVVQLLRGRHQRYSDMVWYDWTAEQGERSED